MSAIRHPNTPTIYDLSVRDDGAYVISQYVEGETLADTLTKGNLTQFEVYRMAYDILEVMHAAQESSIFHCGLHTSSITRIKRARGGHRYILSDLGLSKLASIVKRENVKLVDPVLMAPELTLGAEPNAKADLFMLGQICYTALVGGHPYYEQSAEESFESYKSGSLPPLDVYVNDIDPVFADWVMRMIEFDPQKRFEDSEAAMLALHEPIEKLHHAIDEVHEQFQPSSDGALLFQNSTIPLTQISEDTTTGGLANVKSA